MSIDWNNTGALPLSVADRKRLKALERKDLDGEGLTEVELHEVDALLKGKEAALEVGRRGRASGLRSGSGNSGGNNQSGQTRPAAGLDLTVRVAVTDDTQQELTVSERPDRSVTSGCFEEAKSAKQRTRSRRTGVRMLLRLSSPGSDESSQRRVRARMIEFHLKAVI
jgi:hypothetical protein